MLILTYMFMSYMKLKLTNLFLKRSEVVSQRQFFGFSKISLEPTNEVNNRYAEN